MAYPSKGMIQRCKKEWDRSINNLAERIPCKLLRGKLYI